MVSEERQSAPYAPIANVLAVIRRLRDKGLPENITIQELERLSIPSGNAPRTLAALRFLGLVNDEGQRTPTFEHIGRAGTNEYPEVLAEVIREAYRPVFTIVDPAANSEIEISDAFRHYQPQAQRDRMVTLFMGLCREANIVAGGPPERRPRRRIIRPDPVKIHIGVPAPTVTLRQPADEDPAGADYRLIAALMQQLPKDGKWTQKHRDKWMQAVGAGVDLLTEIVEDE